LNFVKIKEGVMSCHDYLLFGISKYDIYFYGLWNGNEPNGPFNYHGSLRLIRLPFGEFFLKKKRRKQSQKREKNRRTKKMAPTTRKKHVTLACNE
jgi:hypothetical protein